MDQFRLVCLCHHLAPLLPQNETVGDSISAPFHISVFHRYEIPCLYYFIYLLLLLPSGFNTLVHLLAAHFISPGFLRYLPQKTSDGKQTEKDEKDKKKEEEEEKEKGEELHHGHSHLTHRSSDNAATSEQEKKEKEEEKDEEKKESSHFCKYCNLPTVSRSRHCFSCNECVLDFDHHCPFVANCIGRYNHKYFIFFLFYTSLGTLYALMVTYRPFSDCYMNYEKFHMHPACIIFGPNSQLFIAFIFALGLVLFFLSWQFFVVYTKIPTARIIKEFRLKKFSEFREFMISGFLKGSFTNLSESFDGKLTLLIFAPIFAVAGDASKM